MPDNGNEELYAVLEQIYAQIKGRRRRLWPHDRLADDLGIDSVSGLELMVAAEDEFGVELFDDPRVRRLATVADLAALIARCQTDQAGTGSTPDEIAPAPAGAVAGGAVAGGTTPGGAAADYPAPVGAVAGGVAQPAPARW
ncbi:MAG TPA: acyl carrier protein [Micromonosporaceae bacterium]|nr:acyl carrier protein [Micromonosporaceae bacterium]